MSWGQAFGAFGQGLSGGYRAANTAQGIRQERQQQEQQQSAIDALAQRTASSTMSDNAVAEQEAITDESKARTWDLIRSMEGGDYSLSQSYQSQQQGGGGSGMQFDPNMIKNFTGGGSSAGGLGGGMGSSLSLGGAGGGLGGSGLMGSSTGAISAGTNGGASFGLGGSLVGGTGQVGGSTFAASSGAAAGGGGAAAGGGSAAGGAAAGGPWALLAAAIIANETSARKAGRRNENKGKHAQDLITGKVLEQDADYYGDKVGGPLGKSMKFGGQMGNPEGVFNAVKKIFK